MAEALPKATEGLRTILPDWLSSMCTWRWPGPREPAGPKVTNSFINNGQWV